MNLAEVASWQGAVIVALILTNAATLLVAAVAVSLLRAAGPRVPDWAKRLLERLG